MAAGVVVNVGRDPAEIHTVTRVEDDTATTIVGVVIAVVTAGLAAVEAGTVTVAAAVEIAGN